MIRILPPAIAAQIAAGEVVERPASVVKELLENAIDAAATEITVELQGGGVQELVIRDNGTGIPADQIETAFARHATSKLVSADDLFNIMTLGFRGEALPSIAAVAQVSCTSRHRDAANAVELRIAGSEIQDKRSVGAPVGTTFVIRNLFYNLPVRRQFLRSAGAEASAIAAVVTHYALAYPSIRFRLVVDGKSRIHTDGTGDVRSVALAVYGLDVVQHLLPVSYDAGTGPYRIGLHGYASDATVHRNTREAMHISVNGRTIAARGAMAGMFDDAYHTVLMKGRFPILMLALTVDPSTVDVNVHPAKTEVKFRDPEYVRSHVADALRTVIQASPTVQGWTVSLPEAPAPTTPEPTPTASAREQRLGYLTDLDRTGSALPRPASGASRPLMRREVEDLFPEPVPQPQQQSFQPVQRAPVDAQAAGQAVAGLIAESRLQHSGPLPELQIIGQLAGLYILCESPQHELYIIDQHAAHERINYERLMTQAAHGKIEIQALLIPLRLSFVPQDALLLIQHREALLAWGFRIDEDGTDILVKHIPATVASAKTEAALLQIAAALRDAGGDLPADWQERMLITLACHTSIRAGQRLSLAEQTALLQQMQTCANPRTCPHGRPTIVSMRLDLFARQFGRIV
jgi:DNA mismatch repair protein MutL